MYTKFRNDPYSTNGSFRIHLPSSSVVEWQRQIAVNRDVQAKKEREAAEQRAKEEQAKKEREAAEQRAKEEQARKDREAAEQRAKEEQA